ncbi:hypothetical protein FNF27_07645 [Cafeteria roenbergensis]|uniref:Uncharacterized protein n=1 Tax=Cafeteria roenbergensis TaxID=33653 RepID=A0A5A8DJB5_CAFRO|nr:hypothetical protein FNF27_07645 [Cafeteria roenbergensis]
MAESASGTPVPATKMATNLEASATCWSKACFHYLNPLLKLGSSKALESEDIGPPLTIDEAKVLNARLDRFWNDQKARSKTPSLGWALYYTLGPWRLYLGMGLMMITAATQIAPSVLLDQLVSHFEGTTLLDTATLWVMVSLMLVLPIAGGLAAAHAGAILSRVGMHLKTALISTIYRKSLVFRNDGRFSSGEVQNLMSIDAQQLLRFALFAPLVATAPIQIVVCLYLITLQVGQSAWAGIGFLLCLVPVNVVIFTFAKSLRKALLAQTDARVKLMTEILQGIRVIKFFTWEGPMVEKVSRIRARELVVVKKVAYVLAIGFSLVLLSAPVLLPIIVFADYTARGFTLTAAKAFTTIALFGALRFSFAFLPMVLLAWAQAAISIGRIGRFLLAPNMVMPDVSSDEAYPIQLEDASFKWPSAADTEAEEAKAAAPKKRGCCGRPARPSAAGAADAKQGAKKGGSPAGASGGKKDGKQHASAAEISKALRDAEDDAANGGGCCGEAQFLRLRLDTEPLSDPAWQKKDSTLPDPASTASASAAAPSPTKIAPVDKDPPTPAAAADGSADADDVVAEAATEAANAAIDATEMSAGGPPCEPERAVTPASLPEDETAGATAAASGAADAAAAAADADAAAAAKEEAATAARNAQAQVRGASLRIRKGELIAIVGRVGSGKSTLLQGMMGEVPRTGGKVQRAQRVAYVPQAAWITNETVRENILCGEPCDEARLDRAIKVSQLEPDLEQLPRGILTLIGERGVSLSGGQKQRISLARAVYADVSVVLMDDPLSAVDAHVGAALFSGLVCGALAGTTRVLATNALQYLDECDRVVVIENGEIMTEGPPAEVKASAAFRRTAAAIEEHVERLRRASSADEATEEEIEAAAKAVERARSASAGAGAGPPAGLAAAATAATATATAAATDGKAAPSTDVAVVDMKSGPADPASGAAPADPTALPVVAPAATEGGKPAAAAPAGTAAGGAGDAAAGTRTKESRETGAVASDAYWYYLMSGGISYAFLIIAVQLLSRASELGTSFWVSYWADETLRFPLTTDATYFLNMYALIGCVGVLFITMRACFIAECRVRASYILHERLLRHVVRGPAAWFDDTPVGRILNRFAGDMEKVDEQLPPTISQLLGTLVSVVGSIIAIAITSNGILLIALVPLLFFYYRVQHWFRRSSTELQRVESVTRSPIFVAFDSTLDGLSSIRAYNREAAFTRRSDAAIDLNSVPYLTLQVASQWLAMRLDTIGALLAFGVAAVAAATTNFIPAGWVGIGLSTALEMTAFLKHSVRMLAQAETMMNGVERVKEFSEDTPVEGKLVFTKADLAKDPSAVEPEAAWPSEGALAFENVRMRYGLPGRQGPEVLKGLSFSIPARAKVGLVGRTGSGKSSCSMALFRLVELSGGRIVLDGQDISKISLGRLRSSLAIVPQDPVLFSPSVRVNLDPFRKHTDAALRRALAMVELDGKLGLDDEVAEGGSNLSQGTRQLICIARAILRRPRVLIMDEATASVDERTDEVVQRAMREAFRDATVLVIAHRLRTIADSDYVVVLEGGNVAQFDHPERLLDDKERYPESLFRDLVSQTREQSDDIYRLAREAGAKRAGAGAASKTASA